MKCCEIVYWKHDEGWDAYLASDCHKWPHQNAALTPRWFDCAIVEDAPTKAAAQREIASRHVLGICLVSA